VKPTFFSSRESFRAWLEKNHATAQELWVGFYRKDSGKGGITYPEALDEALCLGWIDGLRKRADADSYMIRFTPRKPDSIWSAVNSKRVGELIKLDRMHPAGLTVFESRDRAKARQYSYEREHSKLGPGQEKRFRANRKAWEFFQAQASWYRRTALHWAMSAKREETREQRLATLIEDSEHGRRIKPLRRTPQPK